MRRKTQIASAVVALALAGMALMGHTSADEDIPILDLSLGFPYQEDFQADDGGWETTEIPEPEPPERPDPVSTWEWGIPTTGPGFAASGSNVWATNLDGNYGANHCAGIMSPEIELNGVGGASVSFQSWLHTEASTFSGNLWDAGLLFVTLDGGMTLEVLDPDQGYDGTILSSATRTCLDDRTTSDPAIGGPGGTTPPPAVYETMSADLTPWLGDTVQIVIALGSDSFVHRDGWYVDDFAVEVDQNTVFATDFEADDGDFAVMTTAPPVQLPVPLGWEWGEPTTGPADVPEGTNMWATQLHGDYGHLECSWIESPSFEVGPFPGDAGAVVKATLSWDQWFRSNSLYASGIVQVGHDGEYHIVEPDGGYPSTIGSTSSLFEEVTQWQTDCFGMDWEPGQPLRRAYSGLEDGLSDGMSQHQIDITDFLGEEITIRYLFASGWRDANPTTQPGWYVDNVQVELRAVVSVPGPERLLSGNDAPGWSSEGRSPAENDWEWGLDASGGAVAYGTDLTGDYSLPHCAYIESPVVSGSALDGNPDLVIDHRFGLRATGSFAWYAGLVLVSADGGPWELIEFGDEAFSASTPARTCVNALTGTQPPTGTPAFGGWEGYHLSTADLSDFAGADELQLRFVMGGTSTFTTGCDSPDPCDGWYIRGVQVGSKELLALPGSLLP